MPPVYDAPVSYGAVAELHVPHVSTLLAWHEGATREALRVLVAACCMEATRHGGYVVRHTAP